MYSQPPRRGGGPKGTLVAVQRLTTLSSADSCGDRGIAASAVPSRTKKRIQIAVGRCQAFPRATSRCVLSPPTGLSV